MEEQRQGKILARVIGTSMISIMKHELKKWENLKGWESVVVALKAKRF